jgi:nardilysin
MSFVEWGKTYRTKEQLGYVVDCGTHDTLHVLGFGFRVQSSRFSPPFLEARIHAFIETIPKMLVRLSTLRWSI